MKKIIYGMLLSFFIFGCGSSPTPEIVVITVVVPPTIELATNTLIPTPTIVPTPTITPNPCILWNRVTSEMVNQIVCVRGRIQIIDIVKLEGKSEVNGIILSNHQIHWDFSSDRTGFFTLSKFLGWHPTTGKSIVIGDCVAVTGVIQLLSNGRPYIYWGNKSTPKFNGEGSYYFDHIELQVYEDSSYCE